VVALAVAAAPAAAMTVEECDSLQRNLAATVPVAGDPKLARAVTPDGWCRVVSEPLAGLEWKADIGASGFFAQFRQDRLDIDGLGDFGFRGDVGRVGSQLNIGPVSLRRRDGDAVTLAAVTEAPAQGAAGLGPMQLDGAELRVSGRNGLVGDILAWAFRTDIRRARSSFTVADDQRAAMLEWLDALPAGFMDVSSRAAFREMVEAYPKARGTAVISVAEDRGVALGPLIGAVLFGSDFSEDSAAALVRDAGLTLAWEPE
jgi:hypothetical protein